MNLNVSANLEVDRTAHIGYRALFGPMFMGPLLLPLIYPNLFSLQWPLQRFLLFSFYSSYSPPPASACHVKLHFLVIILEEGSNAPFFSCSNMHHIIIISVSKFKQSIRTAQHDLHVKMCLEIKFYIFWKWFTIFIDRYNCTKSLFLDRNNDFVPI